MGLRTRSQVSCTSIQIKGFHLAKEKERLGPTCDSSVGFNHKSYFSALNALTFPHPLSRKLNSYTSFLGHIFQNHHSENRQRARAQTLRLGFSSGCCSLFSEEDCSRSPGDLAASSATRCATFTFCQDG